MKTEILLLFVVLLALQITASPASTGKQHDVKLRAKRQTGAVFLPAFYFREKAKEIERKRKKNRLYFQKHGYPKPPPAEQPWFTGSWFNTLFA